jgi:hypothetical protein
MYSSKFFPQLLFQTYKTLADKMLTRNKNKSCIKSGRLMSGFGIAVSKGPQVLRCATCATPCNKMQHR